jgi:excinuclease UvrABC nuclease subunit
MSQKVTWPGGHQFDVYDFDATTWHDVGGIYIFTYLNNQNLWLAVYVGKAKSFQNRLPNHERWKEAQFLGATHVHAMVVRQEASREAIEEDLIQACQPPLNTQLK